MIPGFTPGKVAASVGHQLYFFRASAIVFSHDQPRPAETISRNTHHLRRNAAVAAKLLLCKSHGVAGERIGVVAIRTGEDKLLFHGIEADGIAIRTIDTVGLLAEITRQTRDRNLTGTSGGIAIEVCNRGRYRNGLPKLFASDGIGREYNALHATIIACLDQVICVQREVILPVERQRLIETKSRRRVIVYFGDCERAGSCQAIYIGRRQGNGEVPGVGNNRSCYWRLGHTGYPAIVAGICKAGIVW